MKQDTSLTLQHRRQRRPQLDNTLLIPADLCKRVESAISCITEHVETQIQNQCSECEESITVMLAARNVLDDFVHTSSTPELQTRCIAKLTNMLRESRCNLQQQNNLEAKKSSVNKNNIAIAPSFSSSTPTVEVPQGQSHRENRCTINENKIIIIHSKEEECNFKKRFMQVLATEWLFPFLLDCRVRYLHRALTSLFKSIYVIDTCLKRQFRNLFVELLISPLLHDQREINSELALHFLNSLDGLSNTVMPLMPDVFSSTFTQIFPVLSRVLHWMVCKRNSKLCEASRNDSEGRVSNTKVNKNESNNKTDINEPDVNYINEENDKLGLDKQETNSFTNDLVNNIDELRFCIRAVTTYVHRYLGEVRKVWEQANLEECLQESEVEEIEEQREQEEAAPLCFRKPNKNIRQVLVKEEEDKKEFIQENIANTDVTDSVELLLYSGLFMLCNQNLPKDILNAAGLLVASLLTIRTCDHNFIASVCYCTCTFANAEFLCSVHEKEVISKTSQNSSSCSSCSQCTYNVYDELDVIIPVLAQIVCAGNPSNALCALHEHVKRKVFCVFATLLTKVGRFALLKGIMSHLSTPVHEEVQNSCVLLRGSVIDVKLMSKNRIFYTREWENEQKSDVRVEKQSMQSEKHKCSLNGSEELITCCSSHRCVTLFDIIIPAALDYCDALQEPEVRFMAIQTLDGAIRYLSSTFNFALKMLSVKSNETREQILQHQKQSSSSESLEQYLHEKQNNAWKEEELSESALQLQAILSECCASWTIMYSVINKITDIVIELWDDGTPQVSGALYSTYSEILHVHQVILELNKVMHSFNNKELEVNSVEYSNEIIYNKDYNSNAHFDIEYTLRHVCEMHDNRRGKYHALLGLMKIMPLDKFLQSVSWYYSGADNNNDNNNKYMGNDVKMSDYMNSCENNSNEDKKCLQKSNHQVEEHKHDIDTGTCNVNMYGLQKFVHMLLSSANNHKICSIAGEMFVSLITQLRVLQSSPTVCTITENKDKTCDINNNTSKVNKTHTITDKSELIDVLKIESIGLMQPLCNVLLRSDASVKGNLSVCSNVDCKEYLLDHAESQARISHIIVHFIVPLIKENKNFIDELLEVLLAPMPTTSSTMASSSLHEQTKTEVEAETQTNNTHTMIESSSVDYCVVELLSRARSCGIDTAAYVHPSSSVFEIIKRSIHSLSFDLSLSALSLYTLGSRKVRCVSRLQCATMEQYIALHLHLGGDTAAQRAITEVYKKWLKRIHESLSTCYKPKSEGRKKNSCNDKRKRTNVSDIRNTNNTLDNDSTTFSEVSANVGNATSVKNALDDKNANCNTEEANNIISESEWQLYKKMLLVHFANMVQLFMENIGVCREVHDGLSVERRVLAISLYTLTLDTLLQSLSLISPQIYLQIIEKQNAEQESEEEYEKEYASLYEYFPECLITVLVQDLHDGWSYCRHVSFDLLSLYCKNVPALVLRNMCREMSLWKHEEEEKKIQQLAEQEECKVKQIAMVKMYDHFHHEDDGDDGVMTRNVNEKSSARVECNNIYRKIEACKSKVQNAKTYRYAEGAVAEATLLYTHFTHTATMSTQRDHRFLYLQRELHLTEDEINARCAQMQSLHNITEIFTYINDHPHHGLISLSTSVLSLLFTLRDKEKVNIDNNNKKSKECKDDNIEVGNDNPTNENSKETKNNNKSETNVVLYEESNTFLQMCCHVIQTCVSFIGTESTPCLPTQNCNSNGISKLEEMPSSSSSLSSSAKEMAMPVVVVDCRGHVYDKEHPLQEFVMRGVVNNTWLAIRTCTEAIERAIQLCDITKLEFTVVELVCSILLNSLLVTKHNGVMRCVRSSLKVLCIALMRCDPAFVRLHALPEMLLATLLGENGVASSDQNRMLRRSQGLPHAIIAILQSESTQLSKKLFSHCMKSLLCIAQSWHNTSSTTQNTSSQAERANDLELVSQEQHWEYLHVQSHENALCESMPSSTEAVNESACANALNVLKFIFEDKTFAHRVMSFLEEAFTTSCDGFGHRSWYIRNSSLMLFSAVLQRFICQPSSQDNINSSNNNTSLYDIHKRTPRGLSFCYHQLHRYNESIRFDMVNKKSSSSSEEEEEWNYLLKAGDKKDSRENEKNQETMKYSNDNEDINLTIFPIMQMLCMLTPDPPHRINTITTLSPHTISFILPVTTSNKNSRGDGNIHNEEVDCQKSTKHTQEISYGKQQSSSVNANTTLCNASNFVRVVLYCAASSNWLIRASSANALTSIVPVNNVVEVIVTNVAALLEQQECSIYKKGDYVNNTKINTNYKNILDCDFQEQNQWESEFNKLSKVNYNVVHGVLLQLHSFHTCYVGTLHKDRWHRIKSNNCSLTIANHVQLSIIKTILSHSQLVMYCASTCPVIMTELCVLVADIIYFYFNYVRENVEKNRKEEKVMHEESNFDNTDDAAVLDKAATMQSDEMVEMLICLILHTATHQFKAASQFSNTLQSHQCEEEEEHEQEELNEKDEEEMQPFAGRKAVIDSIALVLSVIMSVIPFPIRYGDSTSRQAPTNEFISVQGSFIMHNVLASWKNIVQAECRALYSRWTNCSHNLISSIVSCLVQYPNWRRECTELINTHNTVYRNLNAIQEEKCSHANDVKYVLNNFINYFDCNLIAISGELLTNALLPKTHNTESRSNNLNINATTVQMFTSALEFMTNCIASELATKSASRKANSLTTATTFSSRMTLHSLAESICTSLPLINSLLEEISESMCLSCESKSNKDMTNNDSSGYRLWHNTEVKSAALQYVAYVLALSSQEYEHKCVNNDDDSKSVRKNNRYGNSRSSSNTSINVSNTFHVNNEEECVLAKALDTLMLLLRVCSLPTQPLCLRRAALQTTNIIFSHYRTQIASWFLSSSEELQNGSRNTNNESGEQCCVMSADQQLWGLLTLLRLLFDDVHDIRIKTCVIVSHTVLQLYSPEDHTNVMLSLTALLESAIKQTTSINYAQCRDYLLEQNEQLAEIASKNSEDNNNKKSEEGEDDDDDDDNNKEDNDGDDENEVDEENAVTNSVLFERESDNMFAEPTMITYILHKLFPESTVDIQAYRFTQLDVAYNAAKARLSAKLKEKLRS